MIFIDEARSAALINHELALAAAREALIAAAGGATVFPAVIAHGSDAANSFSVKSGATADIAGLKVGSYWPGNAERGLPRHNSLILLFDQERGRIGAAIEAGKVNAYRTAAADAAAAEVLARPDARTLAIFGAGHQAAFECAAIRRVRPIEHILVVARDAGRGEAFAGQLARDLGLDAEACDARTACMEADIIVTATPARAPLFDAEWVRPGTHVASMGSDARGKQELPPALLMRAALFCDLPEQSVRIGEFQHIADEVAGGRAALTAIGDVLAGRSVGRPDGDAITVFDSSGIALQDLCIGRALLDLATAS